MPVTCHLVLNAGDGECSMNPSEVVEIVREGMPGAHWAAQQAAGYFHDWEKVHERLDDSDFDGTTQVIEVRGYRGQPPQRFRVRCRVVREYEAEPLEIKV